MRTQTRFVLMGVQLLIGLLTLPPQPSWAEPIVLDFEELDATAVSWDVVPNSAKLSDQYLNTYGVSFQSLSKPYVAVVYLSEGFATSGTNGITSVSGDDRQVYDAGNPLFASFYDPANPSTPGVTDFVSLRGDTFGYPEQTVTLEAYDLDGSLLDTHSVSDVGGQTLSVSAVGIHTVKFIGPDIQPYGELGGVGLDDFTFNPITPIPEPSTFILLTSAAAGMLCCLIRKRREAA